MKTKSFFTLFVLALFAMAVSACGALDAAQNLEHQAIPEWPVYSQSILDCNTGVIALDGSLIQPALGCDSWQLNRYERPFNASNQDEYYANLDILSADLGSDGQWFFLRITPYDLEEGVPFKGLYGLEMDLGMEGRGDYLVLADLAQLDEEWDVLGVQVFADSNDDVGNQVPREPDLVGEIDGYDLELFNQGAGVDVDLAWARTVNDIRPAIEIAFKTDLVGADSAFKWWVWSDDGVELPASFDYHDAIAHESAGDVYQGQQFFPSNEIFALDNTCANIWGAPLNDDPSLCNSEVASTPGIGGGEVCLPSLSYESWREAFLISLLSGAERKLAVMEKSTYQAEALTLINKSNVYHDLLLTDLEEAPSSIESEISRETPANEEQLEMWLQLKYREYLENSDCPPPNECPPHFTFWEFLVWTHTQNGNAQLAEAVDIKQEPGKDFVLLHNYPQLISQDNQQIIAEIDDGSQDDDQGQKMKELFLLYILYLEELGCEPPGICPPDLTFEDFVDLFTPPANDGNQNDNIIVSKMPIKEFGPEEQSQINTEIISMDLSNQDVSVNEVQEFIIIDVVVPDDSLSTLQDFWEIWLLVNDCFPPDDYPDLECPEPTFVEWKDWLFTKYPQWINTPDTFLLPFYQLFIDMLDCDDPELTPTPTITLTSTPTDEPCVDGYTPEGLPCEPPDDEPCGENTAAAGFIPCTPTPTEDPCTDGYTPAGVPCDPDDRDDGELLPRPTNTPEPTPTPDETREPRDDGPAPTQCVSPPTGGPPVCR